MVGLAILGLLFLINLIGISSSKDSRIVERPSEVSFQNGRILNDRESTFYYGKEKLLSQKAQTMIEAQTKLEARLAELEKKLQAGGVQSPVATGAVTQTTPIGVEGAVVAAPPVDSGIQSYPAPESLEGSGVSPFPQAHGSKAIGQRGRGTSLSKLLALSVVSVC